MKSIDKENKSPKLAINENEIIREKLKESRS